MLMITTVLSRASPTSRAVLTTPNILEMVSTLGSLDVTPQELNLSKDFILFRGSGVQIKTMLSLRREVLQLSLTNQTLLYHTTWQWGLQYN